MFSRSRVFNFDDGYKKKKKPFRRHVLYILGIITQADIFVAAFRKRYKTTDLIYNIQPHTTHSPRRSFRTTAWLGYCQET